MKKIEQIHSCKHRDNGNSDVFVVSEGEKKELIKQYPGFDAEQIQLYHLVQNYLSTFVFEFDDPDSGLIFDGVELQYCVIKTLPLNKDAITHEEPLDKDNRNYEESFVTTRPEYVEGKMLSEYIRDEKNPLGYAGTQITFWIENELKNKLIPSKNRGHLLRWLNISPMNIKVKIDPSGTITFIVTDICRRMEEMIHSRNMYMTEYMLEPLMADMKNTLFSTLSQRTYFKK